MRRAVLHLDDAQVVHADSVPVLQDAGLAGYEVGQQASSLRLATLRARAKASALRILCCWFCRAAFCA